MNRFLVSLICILSCTTTILGAGLRFENATSTPIEVNAAKASGINAIYVLNGIQGVKAIYSSTSGAANVQWQSFGIRGAAYAQDIPASDVQRNGNEITLLNITPDTGYAITENGKTSYYWIADYSAHPYNVTALLFDNEQTCDRARLKIEGEAEKMAYYSINGRAFEIDRQIKLSYTTLTPTDNEEDISYTSISKEVNFTYLNPLFNVEVPLCDTYFQLEGDRFLRQWSTPQEITSSHYTTQAVSATVKVTQKKRNNDNEVSSEESLGGSAPAEILFQAAVTDAAIFTQWQIANDTEFEDITFRSSDLEFPHIFNDMGTFYVRFTAANAMGGCEYFSDIFTIHIGESELLCPNAFSPGASEGVNDEWKVSYKSIIEFECYIFNRWGKKMAEFHDPAQGWDGKFGGKLVPAGVYYYVIKAKGSDGKEYKLSGDINILNYK